MPKIKCSLTLRAVAWAAVFAASTINLLTHNNYPIFRIEIGLVLLVCILMGGLCGLMHEAARPRLSWIFTGILVGFAVDLNTANDLLPLAAGILALVLAFFWDEVVLKFSAGGFSVSVVIQLVSSAFFGGSLLAAAQTTPATSSSGNDLPPIVHILLDSYLGTGGMGADPKKFGQLRHENYEFWKGHSFLLYDGAYSRHANTANSVPHMLSFGKHRLAKTTQRVQHTSPDQLEYFKQLHDRGYSVQATFPDFIDLCENQTVDACYPFMRSDLASIVHYQMSTIDRASTIVATLAEMSRLTKGIFRVGNTAGFHIGLTKGTQLYDQTKLFPIASAHALEGFAERASTIRSGEVHFGHFLLPHDPYAFDSNCRVRPKTQWMGEFGRDSNNALRDARYMAQMRCTMQLIDKVIAQTQRTPAGRKAIFIIHGDHGSRIVTQRPMAGEAQASDYDLAMTYSTLFAIRGPSIEPGAVYGQAAIEDLLNSFAAEQFSKAPSVKGAGASIILADEQWIPQHAAKLPEFPQR